MTISPKPGFTLTETAYRLGPNTTVVPVKAVLEATAQPGAVTVQQRDGVTYGLPQKLRDDDPTTPEHTILLPVGTDCKPANPTWTVTFAYQGGPTITASGTVSEDMRGASGSLETLRDVWGWNIPALPGQVVTGPLTAAGDLIVGAVGGVLNRLPAPDSAGMVLTSKPTDPLKMGWEAPAGGTDATPDATTTTVGGGLLDANPSSGHPVLTTKPTTDALSATVASNTAAISAEATARQAAITSEASTRATADSTEATARAAADTAEATARGDADTAEATARASADTTETTARIAGDATNATAAAAAQTTANSHAARHAAGGADPLTTSLVTKATNYAMSASDVVVVANAAGLTITIPTAVGQSGRQVVVKNGPSGTNTGIASAGGTMDGLSSVTLMGAYSALTFISDNANWHIV